MKILVLQLKRIGDLILTTPALAALRKHYPNAEITLATDIGNRDLLPALDYVDKTLIYTRKGSNRNFWLHLIMRRYDVCLDFTGNDRSATCSILSKAYRRVAFEWIKKSPLRPLFYNQFVDSSVRENHTIEHYLHMLRALDIDEPDMPVTLHLPEWTSKKALQLLSESQVEQPFAIVHPGTARLEKYWEPERWAEVIEYCRTEKKLGCIITGSTDKTELLHIEKIQKALSAPCPDLSGRLDLLTLGALAQKASIFLGVDSAPMHLASAFQLPQIALFGKTNPFHWRPRHPKAVVILAGEEAPVSVFKPFHNSTPMSEISTEQVTRAIDTLLIQSTAVVHGH